MYEETFGIRREENSVFVTLRPIILFLKKKKKVVFSHIEKPDYSGCTV